MRYKSIALDDYGYLPDPTDFFCDSDFIEVLDVSYKPSDTDMERLFKSFDILNQHPFLQNVSFEIEGELQIKTVDDMFESYSETIRCRRIDDLWLFADLIVYDYNNSCKIQKQIKLNTHDDE